MAVKRKKINVTARDIAEGKPGNFCECPVALAVRRAWRQTLKTVAVRHEGIFVGALDEVDLWIADLPKDIDRFITRFDKGRSVKPVAFQVTFR